MSAPLTEAQVTNWRRFLLTQIGPYALLMPVAEIQKLCDRAQKIANEMDYGCPYDKETADVCTPMRGANDCGEYFRCKKWEAHREQDRLAAMTEKAREEEWMRKHFDSRRSL